MMLCAILPISRSGTAMRTTSAPASAWSWSTQSTPMADLQTLPPLLGNLDMVNLEARSLQVGGKADPHLSAGAEQCDLRHLVLSSFSVWDGLRRASRRRKSRVLRSARP